MRSVVLALFIASLAHAALVRDVRDALARKDWPGAEALIKTYRDQNGVTPEMLEAFSWLGRAALADKKYDDAERNAIETKRLVVEQVKTTKLGSEPHLPIALGAAIEVQAHALAGRGERDQAVDYLKKELATYKGNTIVATRTQKNLHLLSLEGKPAPKLDQVALDKYKGRPVLLLMWAHWCGDCKQQAPVIARLKQEFEKKGLVVVAPTQLYGYAERGRDVGPDEERKYIQKVLAEHYAAISNVPTPVSSQNFLNYGVSTTPTLVLVDRAGIVRMYHPGKMTYEELAPKVNAVLGS